MACNPRKRFHIPQCGFSVWDLSEREIVDPAKFLSMGRSTPFAGKEVFGVNYLTVCQGHVVYKKQK